ncbi:Membrane protein involved in the export of O-antigen and teichoic acid [Halogranum rubrum]|uniref:Membrane protein involved in the export of O-antigen and teichoic acid n=1 Tax=Halogranum rubrum TaxID=553466 RepID=A0A1I4BQJ7_9EURY|nr:polysaccharide biosynthesis C-terminal domain-containing protein [Halogranum rubrum]SFK70309.1 Membrane protein involved in the export of O-antigen and teichoic acid [Halogranum rubrum]
MSLDRSSLALYASRIVISLAGFLGTIYFARELGASGLGVYFTFETVVIVLAVFVRIGVDNAVIKRLSGADGARQRGIYLGGALLLVVPPFLVLSAGVLLFAPQLNGLVELAVAPLVVLTLALSTGRELLIAVLRGERRIATSALLELLGELVRVVASVALVVSGYGVVGLVYGYVIGQVAAVAIGTPLLRTRPRRPSRETFRSLFDFSKYTAGMQVSFLAYSWMDTLLLAILVSKSAVGVYEAAWRVSAVTMLAGQAIGASLAPAVSDWMSSGDVENVEHAVAEAMTYALVLVVPAVVGAALLGEAAMGVLYQFETGGLVLTILVTGKLLQATKDIVQSTLLGTENQRVAFWVNVVTLVANFALNLVLIHYFQLVGAAVATVLTAGTAALAQLWYLRRVIRVRFDWRAIGWQVAAALVMGVVVYGLSRQFPPTTVPRLIATVGVGAAVYGTVVLGHDGMRERFLGVLPGERGANA